MSGPATAAFSFAPLGVVVLAAQALREAQQIGREYQDVLAEMQERADALTTARRQLRAAKRAQMQAEQSSAANSVLKQLPVVPTSMPLPDSAEMLTPLPEPPPLEDALHLYMQQRALHSQLDAHDADAIQSLVARLLARLVLTPQEPLPADIDAASRAVALASNLERAEILALDLRQRIQQHNAQRQQLEQEAAAQVLEQSLRDLGYAVEGVGETLFIEGGVAHFQRHGWGEYFVRLRLNAQDKTLNFNVVRARGAPPTPERQRQDYLAEDRWCREFPKLLETLAARGITLDVQRLLGAGELPVQAVDPASLPAQQTDVAQQSPYKLRTLRS